MSAKIVTIFDQKDGCGRTTVSMHIAGTLGLRGSKMLLVDMDERGTATRWAAQAPENKSSPASVIGLAPSGGAMHQEIRKLVTDYGCIVIDYPLTVRSPSSSSALLISDVALIPVVSPPPNLWAAVAAKTLVQQTQIINEALRIRVLANTVQRRVSLAKQAIEILDDDSDIPLMGSMIGSRSAFRERRVIGMTVYGVPGAREAMSGVDLLIDGVLQLLQEERI